MEMLHEGHLGGWVAWARAGGGQGKWGWAGAGVNEVGVMLRWSVLEGAIQSCQVGCQAHK